MKVLIISHTPISNKNNMGKTFVEMFSSFDKEELCQLYIYPSYPDSMYCSSFYRVTDKDLLKCFAPGGKVSVDNICSENGLYENQNDVELYRNIKNKNSLRRLARDFLWMSGSWYNKKLKNWINQEKPTCIFLAPGVAKFIYWIALKISKEWNIPIITYICDEYYFVKPEKSLFGKIRLMLLKRTIERTLNSSSHIIAISEEIKKDYSSKFNIPATLLMTGSRRIVSETSNSTDTPEYISYFGNIRVNRYLSLAEIGKALMRINCRHGKNYKLKIYTDEKDERFLNIFKDISSIVLNEFLTGEEFDNAMRNAQILLHVEAFDDDSVDRVKHSISTKIADSLASGVALFAYGPQNVSSIKHLIRHQCAVVVTSETELEDVLYNLFNDSDFRTQYIPNALKIARTYHCSKNNSDALYNLLSNIDFKK